MKNKNYFEKKELVSDHQLYKEKKLARDNQLCKEKKLARDNQIRKEKELVSDKIYLEYLANLEDRFLLESGNRSINFPKLLQLSLSFYWLWVLPHMQHGNMECG